MTTPAESLKFYNWKTPLVAFVCAIALFTSTGFVHAQSDDQELRNTIRAAILSDSRSQGMTPEEVEAMVNALTRQAQSVGMTSEDIVWRPSDTGGAQGQPETCEGFLCKLNNAFGFDGSEYTIPIWLGISSLLLIFIIASILEYRHLHHKKMIAQQQQVPPQETGTGMQ